jgi:hypothetical protein
MDGGGRVFYRHIIPSGFMEGKRNQSDTTLSRFS